MSEMGAASSAVAFFRSLGGAAGVAALGALLSAQVTGSVTRGLDALGVPAGAASGGQIPNLATLPAPVRTVIENAYGDGIARVFLAAAPLALVALVAVLFLREVPLRRTIDVEEVPAALPAVHDPDTAPAPLHRPALAGTVRRGPNPAPGAVLTVVDADGHQLGRAVAGGDGSYTVDTQQPGRPHLLVVQWRGTPHVEALGGATGPQYRDVALPGSGGRHALTGP